MVCDCCGRRKRLFESFASVDSSEGRLNFCTTCNDIAYKVRDSANEANQKEFDKYIKAWEQRAKKPSKIFLDWREEFIAPMKKKFESSQEKNEKTK